MGTNHIALLGAGFSRNWGAPLASEVSNSLLREVKTDPYLHNLLTRHEKNFESALSQIQQEHISSPFLFEPRERFHKLQSAIATMFNKLNSTLERVNFEFSQERHFSIVEFLARFDAIFGLNQDLLLELHYEDPVVFTNLRRWNGVQKPGMKTVHNASIIGIGDRSKRQWTPAPPFTVDPRLQPYFKMHGSSNWYTDDRLNLLVMGADKELIIRQSDVLRWYYDQFKSYLSRPDTNLMVIGYSFSDQHINAAIIDAWRNGSLRGVFLVDPAGRSVLDNDLEAIHSLGGSTRLISDTFADDEFEHQKLIDFFRSI